MRNLLYMMRAIAQQSRSHFKTSYVNEPRLAIVVTPDGGASLVELIITDSTQRITSVVQWSQKVLEIIGLKTSN